MESGSESEDIQAESEAGARRTRRGKRRRKIRRNRAVLIALGVLLTFAAGYRWVVRRHRAAMPLLPVTGFLPPQPAMPPGIVFHHSYSPGVVHGHHAGLAKMVEMHEQNHPNWGQVFEGKTYYVGYHYIIRTDGVVEQGRPDLCPGAHARKFNNWLGICLIGDFATNTSHHYKPDHPTKAQIESLITLCESLMAKYHIPPEMIKRHRDVNVTWCPGDNFPYKMILATLTDYARKRPEMYPTPPVILKIVRTPPLKK